MIIQTKRLTITPMTQDRLQVLISTYKESVPELSIAYNEMLTNCINFPQDFLWYTSWELCIKETDTAIGYAGFKGLDKSGHVEIGYGINEEYQEKGYATEGIQGLCSWALEQEGVIAIDAETAPDNIASKRVLEKLGFKSTGTMGIEGPRFILTKK